MLVPPSPKSHTYDTASPFVMFWIDSVCSLSVGPAMAMNPASSGTADAADAADAVDVVGASVAGASDDGASVGVFGSTRTGFVAEL